jgi:hypothetical protein
MIVALGDLVRMRYPSSLESGHFAGAENYHQMRDIYYPYTGYTPYF